MTRRILISPDTNVLARWSQAFPDASNRSNLAGIDVTFTASDVVWLHVPIDAAKSSELVRAALAQVAPARLVALSDVPSDEQALNLMDIGAAGYCHSHAGLAMLQQVATVVENNGIWVGPNLLSRLIRAAVATHAPGMATGNPTLESLSSREREVALAVSAGSSNKEIARELHITERTVKAHLSAIFLKLGVRDRLHLALLMRNPPTA